MKVRRICYVCVYPAILSNLADAAVVTRPISPLILQYPSPVARKWERGMRGNRSALPVYPGKYFDVNPCLEGQFHLSSVF